MQAKHVRIIYNLCILMKGYFLRYSSVQKILNGGCARYLHADVPNLMINR